MKLNNIHLNTTEVKEDSREMKNYFELNGNVGMTLKILEAQPTEFLKVLF